MLILLWGIGLYSGWRAHGGGRVRSPAALAEAVTALSDGNVIPTKGEL